MPETGTTNPTGTARVIGVGTDTIYWADHLVVNGVATYTSEVGGFTVKQESVNISPKSYFKYVKGKFGTLQQFKMDARLKRIEALFDKAVADGQEALAGKFLQHLAKEVRESAIYVKGVKFFIEKDDLHKFKNKIRGGHISDTKLKDFTRVIPEDVLEKKRKVQDVFDDFVIYHYWNPDNKDVKKMGEEEKARMRDPILFGTIKETSRLYFIADWEDEFCDLTFDELIDVMGKENGEVTLSHKPQEYKPS